MRVLTLGEALIDLVPSVRGSDAAGTFLRAAGGAPANVAVGLARLGVAAGFIGCVGDDAFGRFLAETLSSAGVAVDGLRTTRDAPTALAVVTLDAGGDRDFVFYGHPAAHLRLRAADLDEDAIRAADVLHFGTITLADDPARSATLRALDLAGRNGTRVSLDPNLRLPLWPGPREAAEAMRLGLAKANIVKLSEDEVRFLAGDSCDLVEAARTLWHPALEIMAVTRGARGCLWLRGGDEGEVPSFSVDTVDATGAGDAFTAALLARLARHRDLEALERSAVEGAVRFACAAGALATTVPGAVPALPDETAVHRLLARSRA